MKLVRFTQIVGNGVGIRLVSVCLAAVALTGFSTASSEAAEPVSKAFTTGSSDVLIQFTDKQIRQNWEDNEVMPSEVASDAEWIRRVYLDIVGHIPSRDAVEAFLKNKDKAKRTKLIDKLLDDEAYVRNWTTVWTNLLIGRATPRRVSRLGMQKFLREAFSRNRPWNDVVYDIVTAEGHFEENGAVNFLLAQIPGGRPEDPDYVVQATAKTTRLFMGMQVQCTQCHDHPFNDWEQSQFWEFNSFFRQVQRRNYRKYDPRTGRDVDDYSELVYRKLDNRSVFFEKRSGVKQAARPKFFETSVDSDVDVNRRVELAKLMTQGDRPLIARAMVNRTWGHFFGYGFTKPVDDMGPHNAPSHPELLDRLADEFVKSNYDLKQLIRWICNTEAYNLTSRFGRKNEIDNPAAGETPLFSHTYVKQMEAEQLYDSLIVATNAHRSGRSNWSDAERQRQQWMQQFVVAFGTDENDEATTFNGSIPQALMMMNSDLIQNAISTEKGSYLGRMLAERGPDSKRIRKMFLATLSRYPTRQESSAITKGLRNLKDDDKLAAYQDLFWALLNSNEFIFNH